MQPIVKLKNCTKIYGEEPNEVFALKDVSLSLLPGSFTVLAGPSGSGKTTLMNLVGALDVPTRGEIDLKGMALAGLNEAELARIRLMHLGFVFQASNLLPVLSIRENAEFLQQAKGMDPAVEQPQVDELIHRLGLQGLDHRRPKALSGGQQQRAAILRALCTKPEMILADEPTASLDSQTSRELLDLMLQLNAEMHTTFLISSHDPLVLTLGRTVIHIRDGQIANS